MKLKKDTEILLGWFMLGGIILVPNDFTKCVPFNPYEIIKIR